VILPVSWRCARSTLRSNAFQGVRIPTRTQVVASFMRCKPVVGKPVEARLGVHG